MQPDTAAREIDEQELAAMDAQCLNEARQFNSAVLYSMERMWQQGHDEEDIAAVYRTSPVTVLYALREFCLTAGMTLH